jgi:heme-degrading monooxygenase HmoA
VIVREFWVVEGRECEFEKEFRAAGAWVELLRRSEEYLGTELRQEPEGGSRYRVFDYWRSHRGFEAFRVKHQRELEEFSRLALSEAVVEREVFEGSFYENDPDLGPEEGTDLVPS